MRTLSLASGSSRLGRVLFGAAAASLAALPLVAQQPTPPASALPQRTGPVLIDGIVAVVGDQPVTRADLEERVLGKIQRGEAKQPTTDSAAKELERSTLDDLIEEELLLQKAKDLKIDVTDADVAPMVDRQVAAIRAKYRSESEYRSDLVRAGLGTPEEYRRFLIDQYRRQSTLDKTIRKLTDDGKIVPVPVTDAEIQAEFERTKPFLGPKPAAVTFKQIVIPVKPSDAAREVARVKAESLLAQIKRGEDFDRIAKRESMDSVTKDIGGDIGWRRRGDDVPEFDRWLFGGQFQAPLQPGQTSPVFETQYGFHILRVDRVQPGRDEVKARQILIVPTVDSNDVARTRVLADSVANMLKAGVPFDTLARKYHDYADKEETSILTPWPRDSLPESYQKALTGLKPGDITTFQIPWRPDVPKYVVLQLLTDQQGGERTLSEMKSAVRSELSQRGGIHRYVDTLRKQTYVSILLDAPLPGESKAAP